jgi:urease accessory protein
MSTVMRDLCTGAQPAPVLHPGPDAPGTARMQFCRGAGGKTSLGSAFARSPLRLLTPRNHGDAAWVYLSSFGGGLVDGDRLDVRVDVDAGASALLGTQSSTKVYRSRARSAGDDSAASGCAQKLTARVGDGASLVLIPDPVVCFADARYDQTIDIALAPTASLVSMDGYTCGRSARGERWAFARYASRTVITRSGATSVVDATRLDPRHGPIADRMGRFDVVLSLIALGPRFAPVRDAMLALPLAPGPAGGGGGAGGGGMRGSVLVAASALGDSAWGGCIVRVAAERFETASLALRSSFAALAHGLGDDPFARKW